MGNLPTTATAFSDMTTHMSWWALASIITRNLVKSPYNRYFLNNSKSSDSWSDWECTILIGVGCSSHLPGSPHSLPHAYSLFAKLKELLQSRTFSQISRWKCSLGVVSISTKRFFDIGIWKFPEYWT